MPAGSMDLHVLERAKKGKPAMAHVLPSFSLTPHPVLISHLTFLLSKGIKHGE